MKHRMGREWARYAAAVMPPSASPIQIRETRRAFYAGAQALLAHLTGALTPGTAPHAEDLQMLTEIDHELHEFVAKVQAGTEHQ